MWSPIPMPSIEFWTPAFSDDLRSFAKRLDIGSDLVILTFIGNGSVNMKCNFIQQIYTSKKFIKKFDFPTPKPHYVKKDYLVPVSTPLWLLLLGWQNSVKF